MVSVLDSRSSAGRGHCVMFLDKTLNSHGASLHLGVIYMGTAKFALTTSIERFPT